MSGKGAKYHKANDAVRVILCDGSIKQLSTPSNMTELSEDGQEMCQYVGEMLSCANEQILQISSDMTNLLTSLEAHCGRGPDVSLFPIVVGRRPMMLETSSSHSATAAVTTQATAAVSQPSVASSSFSSHSSYRPSQTQSLAQRADASSSCERSQASGLQLLGEVSVAAAAVRPAETLLSSSSQHRPTATRATASNTQRSVSVAAAGHPVTVPSADKQRMICSVEVPGIGRAAKYTHGLVWLYYNDGSQLGVKVTSPSYIVHVSQSGHRVTYQADDEIPESVRCRVASDLQASMAHLNMLREV